MGGEGRGPGQLEEIFLTVLLPVTDWLGLLSQKCSLTYQRVIPVQGRNNFLVRNAVVPVTLV